MRPWRTAGRCGSPVLDDELALILLLQLSVPVPDAIPTAPSQLRMVLALQTLSPAAAVEDVTPRDVEDALAQPTVMTVTPSTSEG